MSDLSALISRVRLTLDDPDGKRFSDTLLTTAIRQALEQIDQRLPRNLISDVTAAANGREQPLNGLTGCIFLVKLVYPAASDGNRELEPETEFSYVMRDGTPTVHFYGDVLPQAGEVLLVHYAAQNTIEGLDDALSTTLPEMCEAALVNGAAGCACALRAGSLVEAYGSRPAEAAQMLETSRYWMDVFSRGLDGLKVLQDFGFPPGFALDGWDRAR